MAVLNGRIPDALLNHLPWPEASGFQLRPDAADAAGRLATAFRAHFGVALRLTDAYRTYDTQVLRKVSRGVFAATPGTSNHGLGVAIDFASSINIDGSAQHAWMVDNAGAFGWIWPQWARDWNPSNGQHEPWHWEYHPELDQHTAPVTAALAPAPALAPLAPLTLEDEPMLIIESPGALSTLQGATLAGLATTAQADALTAKGVQRVVYTSAEFALLRQACAGRELIVNPSSGYAVGIPGGRYVGLGDIAEVQYHQSAGCRERTVSVQTFANLTA